MNLITMRSATRSFLLVLLLTSLQPAIAAADKNASREREQVRRLMQARKKLEDENGALKQEKVLLETKSQELADKVAAVEDESTAAKRRNAALTKSLGAMTTDLNQTKQALEEKIKAEKELVATLAARESSIRKLQLSLDATAQAKREEGAMCEAKNVALYLYCRELLAKVEGRGALDRLLASEPLFGIKRVEIENTVQDYRDKLDAERFRMETAAR